MNSRQCNAGLRAQTSWAPVPTPPATGRATLGELFRLSGPQFPPLTDKDDTHSASQNSRED